MEHGDGTWRFHQIWKPMDDFGYLYVPIPGWQKRPMIWSGMAVSSSHGAGLRSRISMKISMGINGFLRTWARFNSGLFLSILGWLEGNSQNSFPWYHHHTDDFPMICKYLQYLWMIYHYIFHITPEKKHPVFDFCQCETILKLQSLNPVILSWEVLDLFNEKDLQTPGRRV